MSAPARSAISIPPLPALSPTECNWLWRIARTLLRSVLPVWLRYRALGTEHIPAQGGGLILSNHQSFLDPVLIGVPLQRPVSFLARDSLFRVPLLSLIIRNLYAMPINREAVSTAGLKETLRRVEQGYLVGIFPEGTRSDTGTVGRLKPGFISLVRRMQLPIYPVGIAGAHHALGRGSWFIKPAPVRVVFGEPILPEALDAFRGKGQEQALLELVQERIVACQQTAVAWLEHSHAISRAQPRAACDPPPYALPPDQKSSLP